MFQVSQSKTDKNTKIILATRLILFFILIFAVVSCAPRSVRHSSLHSQSENIKKNRKSQQVVSKPKESDEQIKQIEEFSKIIAQKQQNVENFKKEESKDINQTAYEETFIEEPVEQTSEVAITSENSVRKIPTLREQMKIFTDKQDATDEKVQLLQSDVNDIKLELSQIKQAIIELEPNDKHNYTKGSPEVQKPVKVKTNKSVILPDEKQSKVEKKTEKKPETKPQITQETKIISTTSSDLDSGKTAFETGKFKDAINILENAIANESSIEKLSESHFYLGESYFATEQFQKAIKNYKRVIEIEKAKRKDKAQSQIAESYIKTGNINEAKVAYSDLITMFPKSQFVPKAKKMLQQL